MAKLGIVLDKANEADSLLGENGEPADGELARKVAQAEAETDIQSYRTSRKKPAITRRDTFALMVLTLP